MTLMQRNCFWLKNSSCAKNGRLWSLREKKKNYVASDLMDFVDGFRLPMYDFQIIVSQWANLRNEQIVWFQMLFEEWKERERRRRNLTRSQDSLINWHPTAASVSVVRQKRNGAMSLVMNAACVRHLPLEFLCKFKQTWMKNIAQEQGRGGVEI